MIDPIDKSSFMEMMDLSEQVGDYSEPVVNRFWDWMYSDQEGEIQVCAFPVPPEGKSKSDVGQGKWIHARNYDEYEEFCRTHSGLWRYHVYSGVNTLYETPEYGRGKTEHINKVRRLTFDIETERDSYQGSPKEHVWWCYKYSLAHAKYMQENYGVWPLIVMSENGIHMHFNVEFECSDDMLYESQHICSKYLTLKCMNSEYADLIKDKTPSGVVLDQDDVSDPVRVMKVPGTKGIKSEQGRLCGIIHEPPIYEAGKIDISDIDATLEEMLEYIEEHNETADDNTSSGGSSTVPSVSTSPSSLSDDLKDKVVGLCRNDTSFRDYWTGDLEHYESRSEAEFAFIVKMLNHGFSEDEIVDVMWASGMSKWKEESDHYRSRTVENAIDYFDGSVTKTSRDGSFSFSDQ